MTDVKRSATLFQEACEQLLHAGYAVRFRGGGTSMAPTIADGEMLSVAPARPDHLVCGDIVLCRRPGGLLAHRVARIRTNATGAREFLLKGDAKAGFDAPIRACDVLGKVEHVHRANRAVRISSTGAKLRFRVRTVLSSVRQALVPRAAVVAMLAIAGSTAGAPAEAAVAQRVQSGTAVNTANGIQSIAITSVDTTKSFLIFETRTNSTRPVGSTIRGRLASATTIEFERVTDGVAPEPAAINIQWYVVTFGSGVRVQRGEVAQAGTTVNVPISAVASVSQSFVLWSKTMAASDATWADDDAVVGEVTSTTNLQFRTAVATAAHTIAWQVVEFTNAADINVQKGSITTMTGATTSVTATLSPAVDVSKTFVLVGWRTNGTGVDIGSRMLRARLTSSTTITIDRSVSGTPDDINEIVWQAVELKDGSRVWGGNASFAAGDSQVVAQFAAPRADMSRAVAFGSAQGGSGQNMGRSAYVADDIIGVGAFTTSLGPAFRAASSASAASGVLTLSINVPAGTEDGDAMIASVGFRPQTAVLTPPAGWTLVRRTDNAAGNSLATYWKVADDAEPASYSWILDTSTGSVGGILAFSGVDSANPIDVEAGQNTPNALTHDAPGVTTTGANEMLVTAHSFMSSATWTPPAGMTEAVDRASEAIGCCGQSIEVNYALQPATGATGVRTATASNDTDAGNAHTVALRSGGSTAHVTITRDSTVGAADLGWFVVQFNRGPGFRVGSFTKSTGAAPATQTIAHGLGEAPKAIILWTDGKTNEAFGASYMFGFGMSDGTTSKSVATASQNGVTPSNASTRMANKVLTIVQWGETLVGEADLQSWNDTNFVLNWTTNNATAYVIHYIVIGGSDVAAKVLEWTTAAGTGNQAVTGIGFQPNAVIHAHGTHAFTAALPSSVAGGGFGLGVMDADGDEWALSELTVDGVGTSDTQRGQQTDASIYTFNSGLAVQKKASWVSMNPDGFTLNFTNAGSAAAARMLSLALKGVNVKPGSFLKTTGTGPASQSIAGVGFTPGLVLLASVQDLTRGAPVAQARFGIGASDGTTQGSSAFSDQNGVGTTNVDAVDKTSKVFVKNNNTTATINAEADLSSLDADGFTLNWTTNDAVQTQILYFSLAPLAETEVRLLSLNASRYSSGVLVEWRTGYEIDNLGFHVYRELNGERTRVTGSPIAGSGLMAGQGTAVRAEQRYAIWDTSAMAADSAATYWLEDLDFNGASTWHGPVIPVQGRLAAPAATAPSASLAQFAKSGKRRGRMFRTEGARLEKARKPGLRGPSTPYDTQWVLAAGPAVKIAINRPGWYRITQPELVAAGLDAGVDPRTLRLFIEGVEQIMTVRGESDGRFDAADSIEFYGAGTDTPFTDTRIYWLTASPRRASRMPVAASRPDAASTAEPASFTFTVQQKERSIYFAALRNGDEENWFGAVVSEEPADLITALSNVDASRAGELELTLQGITSTPGVDPDHDVTVSINGTDLGRLRFDGQAKGVQAFPVPPGVLRDGDNIISLTAVGGETDYSLVDVVRITYAHTYRADADLLRFTADGQATTTVRGFASRAIRVVDITDPLVPVEIRGAITPAGGLWSVTVSNTAEGTRTFLAFAEETVARPASVRANSPSRLHAAANALDYVALSHADFVDSAKPLIAARERQGYMTALVDVDDVYDEFSFGEKTPQAIRDFMVRARTSWKRAPRFLALLGDATIDPRDYAGFGDADFVPTRQVPMARVALETASDDWFVDMDDDGLPELAVGRFPVRTAEQADTVLRKLLDYERGSTEAWTREVLLVADQNDTSSNFDEYTSRLARQLPTDYTARRISRSTLDAAAARQELIDAVNSGQLIVSYQGHGSVRMWGHDGEFLTSDDVRALWRNNGRLPLVIAMNCLNGFFQGIYDEESLAETLLRAEDGGAVAAWASSSVTDSSTQAIVNQELFRLIFSGSATTVGEAISAAKRVVSNRDLRRSWIFFGDPAMRLANLAQQPTTTGSAVQSAAPGPGRTRSPQAEDGARTDAASSTKAHEWPRAKPESRLSDWDGDGRADVFIHDASSWRTVLSGSGRTVSGSWDGAWESYPANLNGDALTDLLIFDRSTGVMTQALNTGRAVFRDVSGVAWGTSWQLHVGEFTGDRLDDVLLTDPATGLWFLCINDGQGSFRAEPGSWPTASTVTVGDFSGDERADAFLYDPATGDWTMALSKGNGQFTTASGTWAPGFAVRAANLNQDGRTDLVAYNEVSGASAECTTLAAGGFFCSGGRWEPGLRVVLVAGERRDDELLYRPATGEWTLLIHNGGSVGRVTGTWAPRLTIGSGDLDGDGREDLVLYDPANGRWIAATRRDAGRFVYTSGQSISGGQLAQRP